MVPQRMPDEPDEFKRYRESGNHWLNEPPGELPKGDTQHWRRFMRELRAGFRSLCSYGALWEANGTVDHFLSQKNHRGQIFEWGNYRYASGWVNSSKKDKHDGKLLDPLEVGEGWFELDLPSYQLRLKREAIPADVLPRAEETMRVLKLADRENLVAVRQEWHRMYLDGELTLEGLRKKAPLLAAAVERQRTQAPETPPPPMPQPGESSIAGS